MNSREDDRSTETASQNAATAGKDAGNPANEKVYKVLTKDKEVCEVPASVIGMSKLITTMLEDLNLQDDDAPIPVPNVTASVFRKVVKWCDKHKSIPETVVTHDSDEAPQHTVDQEIEKWDEEYFKVDHGMLFDIIMAANYLDIPGLLDSSCKVVAAMMRGKTPEEIRVMFNITNDFTPEEEENIRKENAWCEE
ncbi:hypothetical protein Aduo_002259 [Ancylostoma duodenale]